MAGGYSEGMGITVSVNREILSVITQILLVASLGIVMMVIAALISWKRFAAER